MSIFPARSSFISPLHTCDIANETGELIAKQGKRLAVVILCSRVADKRLNDLTPTKRWKFKIARTKLFHFNWTTKCQPPAWNKKLKIAFSERVKINHSKSWKRSLATDQLAKRSCLIIKLKNSK